MPIPFDVDILAFLWATGKVMFGSKARLRKNARPIPLRFDVEEIPEDQLTPSQKEYLRPLDAQLEAMNYRPLCTFRAKNFGSNLLRRYSNPADTASFALTIVEVKVDVNGLKAVKNSCSAEFTTRFLDGKRLITKNAPLKALFEQPPYRIVQKFPNVTKIAELKRKHDKRASELGVSYPPPQSVSAVFEEFQAEHERYSNYQLECGGLRLSPDGSAYLHTDKVLDRGIRNHFLPFGRRTSLTHLVFSTLIGAVLPLFGILKAAPWIASKPYGDLLRNFPLAWSAIALCYALAGITMGYFCDAQKFAWIILVTYVPAHLVAAWTFGWFPYSTLCFVVCYQVAQAKRRRALILQT